jgi:hypothetical protein
MPAVAGAAREHVRVARALGALPGLARALARGELSYSKVRALTRVATPETEDRLLAFGRAGTAEHVERLVRGWRQMDLKAEAREAARRHASRFLHVYPDSDGTVRITGRLTAELGALVVQALTAARETAHQRRRDQEPEPDSPTMEQQQADALVLLAETALHHGIDPGAPGERYQWWSTSMPRCSRTPAHPASRRSKMGRAFPRERPSAWRATRAGS